MNTKIVFSLVSKERYVLRVLAWVSLGLITFVFVYALFMGFIMLMVFIANTFMELTV